MQTKHKLNRSLFGFGLMIFLFAVSISAQTTEFVYQGKLSDAGNPPTAVYQMEFKLFGSASGADQIGATFSNASVSVTAGIFNVQLDFGAAAFDGSTRFLEIAVKRNAGDPFTVLTPRQKINSAPYAIKSKSSETATNSTQLGGVAASEYVTTTTVGNSFVNNATTQQTANFNINGNGFIGGNVGVGTTNPASKLDVRGSLTLDAGGSPAIFTAASGGEQNRYLALINSPTTQTASGFKAGGVLVSNDYFFDNPGKSDLVVKGNVGIGTPAFAATKMTIAGQNALEIFGFQPFLTITDSSVFGLPARRLQSASGVLNFQRCILNNPCSSYTTDMVLNASGNLGIGTVLPNTRLTLSGGPGWTSNAWTASMNLQNAAAIGWEANASGQRFGIGQSTGGLYFFRTSSAFGTNGTPAIYDLEITDNGLIKMKALQITGGSDLAENFEFAEEAKPGMVVAIDSNNAGKLTLARGTYNRRVAGIVSGANNLSAGMVLPDLKDAKESLPLALSGRVWVYADASQNPIKPGDLLTTSDTPGYAMKVRNYKKAQGAVIGKAMSELKSGKGLVLVLVTLQ